MPIVDVAVAVVIIIGCTWSESSRVVREIGNGNGRRRSSVGFKKGICELCVYGRT